MTFILEAEQLETLTSLAEDSELTVYPEYSGRGMMGGTCFGVVGRMQEFVNFTMRIATEAATAASEQDDDQWLSSLVDVMSRERVSIDDMGRDQIFYWVGIKAEMA